MTAIIAHRGGADLWPENTSPAFMGAIAAGAEGAELDVHLTKDGEVVVYHDEALKPEITRASDGRWLDATGPLLKDLLFAETQAYDVGRLKPNTAYGARHPRQQAFDGTRIPRLAEVVALARAQSDTFQFWIELKTDLLAPARGANPVRLAEAALAIVRAADFEGRTVFVSFDWQALAAIKSAAPHIPVLATTMPWVWFQTDRPSEGLGADPAEVRAYRKAGESGPAWLCGLKPHEHGSWPEMARAIGADGWFPHYRDLDPTGADTARRLGLDLAAWTVPPSSVARMRALGVRGICTDDPVRAREAIDAI